MLDDNLNNYLVLYSLKNVYERIIETVSTHEVRAVKATSAQNVDSVFITRLNTQNPLDPIAEVHVGLTDTKLTMRIRPSDDYYEIRITAVRTISKLLHFNRETNQLEYNISAKSATEAITLWKAAVYNLIADLNIVIDNILHGIDYAYVLKQAISSEFYAMARNRRMMTNNRFRTDDDSRYESYDIEMGSLLRESDWVPDDVINMIKADPFGFTESKIIPSVTMKDQVNDLASKFARSLIS